MNRETGERRETCCAEGPPGIHGEAQPSAGWGVWAPSADGADGGGPRPMRSGQKRAKSHGAVGNQTNVVIKQSIHGPKT